MCNCTTTLHRYAYICNGPILLQCVKCKLKPLHVQAPMHTHMIQSPMCLCIPAQVSRRMHKADLITEQRPELTHFFSFSLLVWKLRGKWEFYVKSIAPARTRLVNLILRMLLYLTTCCSHLR